MTKSNSDYAHIEPEALMVEYGLTVREALLTSLLCKGHNPEEIAKITSTSVNTVRTHIKSVFQKTGANSQLQLVSKIFTGKLRK